jgi:lipopolysaccharide transport system ATP-binding protein
LSENNAIEFTNVTKKYLITNRYDQGIKGFLIRLIKGEKFADKEQTVIDNFNLKIPKGEFMGLVGRNGAGKSTTLGLIAKVIYPTSGQLKVIGRVAPLLELGAGFHTDLTGKENIMINGVLLGLTREQVKEKMEDIIEFSGLREFIDRPMRTYSSGMYMRLGFSVAVNINPDILLVDEVLAVGDEEFQKKCLEKMQEFKTKGKTIIFVTHSLEIAEKVCDRIAYIEHGKLMMIGPAHEVIAKYKEDVSHG